MRAFGSDRLRLREDGVAILSCRMPKQGWQARIEKSLTSPLHPGTAVLCEDEYWEVTGIEVLQVGVRYTLEKWPENSAAAMPLVDRYDEEREAEREADRKRVKAGERGRIAANLLAVLTGHLPSAVQTKLAEEINVRPVRLTMISTVPQFAAAIALGLQLAGNMMPQYEHKSVPAWVGWLVVYLFIDALVRFFYAMTMSKPTGSVFGLIGYSIFYALSPNKSRLIGPFSEERGSSVKTTQLTTQMKAESDVTALEPLLSLLDEGDQRRLAEKYGINYQHTAKTTATTIVIFAFLGMLTAIPSIRQLHLSGLVALLVAGFLLVEQLIRISQFERGPASSVLRFIVRPFVARYLA